MAIRTIRLDTDELLRKKSKEVKQITPGILTLLDDMAETMVTYNGIGLAAPQVGVLKRIVVIDIGEGLIELINPVIVETRDVQQKIEGCLSVPGKTGRVKRPYYVRVKALNRNNEEITLEGEGLLSTAFCHEIDHLDGIIFTDKVEPQDLIYIDDNEK